MQNKFENDLEERINRMLDFSKSGGTPKYDDVEKLIKEAKNIDPKDLKGKCYLYQLNNLSSTLDIHQ